MAPSRIGLALFPSVLDYVSALVPDQTFSHESCSEMYPSERMKVYKTAGGLIRKVEHIQKWVLDNAQRIKHFLGFLVFPEVVVRAARVADSKTSRTPSLVLAEHSRYLTAWIFFCISSA
jgi:hypothetical protein